MNPYHHLVAEYARLAREGKSYPLSKFPRAPRPDVAADAPKALIFSPHPDDEVITGGLALRLLREAKWNVINVAVTQGSKKERQAERFSELQGCCDCIGFGLIPTAEGGLENVNLKTRTQNPAQWHRSVSVIVDILARSQPHAVFFPHEADWHASHIGTHFLVMDALKNLPADFECHVVETEFWGAMASPNLMVEISARDLADLMTALTFHAGEVRRNAYHLSLPAWMMDNVRRGGELAGGPGATPPDFVFATLYRLSRWRKGKLERAFDGGRQISARQNPAELFP
jgi:LmbE family N-acetylglucosaminyl deacetylase